jgi:hypothetical protein
LRIRIAFTERRDMEGAMVVEFARGSEGDVEVSWDGELSICRIWSVAMAASESRLEVSSSHHHRLFIF